MLTRYWPLLVLAILLSIATSTGLLWFRREAWMPSAPIVEEPSGPPRKPLPGMSMAFTEWDYHVDEVEALRKKLQAECDAVEAERTELHQEAAMIRAEKEDLERIRKEINQLRTGIEKQMVEIEAEEKENMKKLADVYASMKANEAQQILSRMEISVAVKIFTLMPEDISSRILSEMVKGGESSIQRAAEICDEMRKVKK